MPELTLKEEAQKRWGDLARFAEVDAMLRACEQLQDAGEPLNRHTLREASGVTSNNLLAYGLQAFKNLEEMVARSDRVAPAVLIASTSRAINEAFKKLEENYEFNAFVAGREYLELIKALEEDLKASEERHAEMEREMADLRTIHSEAVEQIANLKGEATQLKDAYQRALTESQSKTDAIHQIKSERDREQHRHQQALADLKTSHAESLASIHAQQDKERDRLMIDIDSLRVELKHREAKSQDARLELVTKNRELESDLRHMKSQLITSEKHQEAQNKIYQEQHTKQQETIDQLRSELDAQQPLWSDQLEAIQQQISAFKNQQKNELTDQQAEGDEINE